MRKIKYSLMLLPAFVLLTLAFCFRETSSSDSDLVKTIVKALQKDHYEPKSIDDKFSKELFELYLKTQDGDKRFFLKGDIDSLKEYQTKLDDQAKSGQFEFFDKVNAMHVVRVARAEKWYKEILSKPFNFTSDEFLEYDEENPEYLNTEAELKSFWTKNIKRQVLERYYSKVNKQEKALERKDTTLKVVKSNDSLEAEARQEELKSHNEWFSSIKKLDHKDKISTYMNCMTEIFDPHTGYFPPQDKENFDIRMSGKLEGIGAQLQEKDGYLKVASIVPGSPSFKQGQLKAGDIILKVAQGDAEPVDVTNMKIDDAIQLIRGKKGTEVRLTVKKPDESIVIIPIIRDVIVIEDSYAKSMIIVSEGKKYGYINLPSFYVDMNDKFGRSCAKDIEEEINKLSYDQVSGIILDLRNNGGGSLGDVVTIGGLFIKRGPMTLVKQKGYDAEMLGDGDGKVRWDGPLTIMVNEISASASEILAAAMQDYGRAVIIGTPTYGKGTVQRFIDLDEEYPSGQANPMGALKMTIQKFYRINGSTTQLTGVIPDIIIPDRYRYLKIGERENKYALASDKIKKANYEMTAEWADKIKKAVANSKGRIASNMFFQEIELLAKKIEKLSKKTKYTLNYNEYKAEMEQNDKDNKRFEELMKTVTSMSLENTSEDNEQIGKDESKKRIKDEWNKSFEKDIYIQEAVNVLKDLN
jgi:carboxyl-terminal processing protease